MIDEFGFTVIDGSLPIHAQQQEVRNITQEILKEWQGLPAIHAAQRGGEL